MAEIVGAAYAVRCAIRRMPSWRSPGYAIAELPEGNRHGVQHRRGVPQAALAIQGSPKTYTKKGDSARTSSQVLPNCGSTILSRRRSCPESASCGRDPRRSLLAPATMEIYCDSAQPG